MPIQATAEPGHQVVRSRKDIGLQQYGNQAVVEVLGAGPAGKAVGQALSVLAGDSVGKNKGARTFWITAPVIQNAAPSGFPVQFGLVKAVTVASAYEPGYARVHLLKVICSAGGHHPPVHPRDSHATTRCPRWAVGDDEHVGVLLGVELAPRGEHRVGQGHGGRA